MSGLVTGIVLDRYPNGGGERLVAVALADNAHRDGTRIFPSVGEVAERTKLSRRTVQLHLAKMVAAGWLILTKKSSGRRGDTNEYRISPEWLAGGECTPPPAPVLRTNAKRPWGANIAPHEGAAWGEASSTMGCNLTQDGVKPIAPKPSGTVKEPIPPYPPRGGAAGETANAGEREPAPEFDTVVAEYPRKSHLSKAAEEWRKLAPDAQLAAEIVASIRAWSRSPEWQREDGRFVPKLSNWLRDKRWQDVPGYSAPPPTPAPTPAPAPVLSAEQLKANGAKARAAAAHARALLGGKAEGVRS
jgi:hypothetical protein